MKLALLVISKPDVVTIGQWLSENGFFQDNGGLFCSWVSSSLLSSLIQLYFLGQLVYIYQYQIYLKPLEYYSGTSAKEDYKSFVCERPNLNSFFSTIMVLMIVSKDVYQRVVLVQNKKNSCFTNFMIYI
jgi:hypothetical protein